jgi:hypothetical protein
MRKIVASFVLPIMMLAACGRDEGPGGKKDEAEPAKPPLCPLTGTEAPQGLAVERPALAVKLDNSSAGRPQAGLESADVVYEELAEGGITRFLAVFHCADAATLGPIRSARNVDPELLVEYSPVLFGYSGAAPPVQNKVASTKGITDLRHGTHGNAYQREKTRKAPLDLFSSTEKLRTLEDAQGIKGPPRTGLVFDAGVLAPATTPSPTATSTKAGSPTAPAASPAPAPGNTVTFNFSAPPNAVKYTYDAGSKKYLRFHGNTPHNSAAGSQITTSNVVVLKVRVVPGTIRDAAGSLSPDIAVVGEGDATVVRGGTSVTGKWKRAGLSDRTTLVDAAGKPIKLAPGNTWIHLLPADRPVTVQ